MNASLQAVALCEIELGDRKIAKDEIFECDAAQHADLLALGAVAPVADESQAEAPARSAPKLSVKPASADGEDPA